MDPIEAVSYLAIALYLLHLGRRLQREQDEEDRLGAPPPRLTCVESPPAPALLPRQDNAGKPIEAGGVRIPLERVL